MSNDFWIGAGFMLALVIIWCVIGGFTLRLVKWSTLIHEDNAMVAAFGPLFVIFWPVIAYDVHRNNKVKAITEKLTS